MYQLIESKQSKRSVVHTIKNAAGETEEITYLELRGGLCWNPLALVVGGKDGRIIRVTAEIEGNPLDLSTFFDKVSDLVSLHIVSEVYADTSQDAYHDAFVDWSDRRSEILTLAPAPYLDTPQVGLSLIRAWDRDGLLRISKDGQLYEALKSLSEDDVEELPGNITALMYLVSGFSKSPPVRSDYERYAEDPGQGGEHGWMLG
jgi:hypothetical protein